MKRLTYQTVGDAMHPQHYCHGPGIRKDDLLQRLGKLEDAIEKINGALFADHVHPRTLDRIKDIIVHLEVECHENDA